MIDVKGLTKRYKAFTAVDGISFQAKKGEIIGLLGPNGAGKTTTIRMLTGFMPPSAGRATIAGYDIVDDSIEVRRHVGYMPERVPMYPDMTARGFITFWAKLRGISNVRQQVDEVLARVQLSDRENSLIRNLSKGMRQRLALAQALVHRPDVVILDEPTIGIDPQQVIEVRETVRSLGQDHTVLFSTHILSEAEQVCDRVLIIDRGKIVAAGKPAELRKQLQPVDSLYIQIGRMKQAEAQKLLESIPEITHIEKQGAGFVVRSGADHDVRAAISEAVAAKGGVILELRPVAMTLEEIFLDLVGRNQAV